METDDINFKNIIDIRDSYKFNKNHISGSINITYPKILVYYYDYLNKNDLYLLVCDKGIQSYDVSKILNKLGYHTYSLRGGISSLK